MSSYGYSYPHHDRSRDPYYSSGSRNYDHRYSGYETSASTPRSSTYNYNPHTSRNDTYNTARRPRYPPPPSVEDDLSDGLGSEACMRGSVDQYPIIEDVEQDDFEEQRFVMVNGGHISQEEDPQERKSRRDRHEKVPAPDTTVAEEPSLFGRRAPSPYAYTKPTSSETPSKRTSAEYFLSPESATFTSPSIPRSVPDENRKDTEPPARKTERSSNLSSDVFEASDGELDESLLKNTRPSARYSFTPNDHSREDMRRSLHESKPYDNPQIKPTTPRPHEPQGSGDSSRGSSVHSHERPPSRDQASSRPLHDSGRSSPYPEPKTRKDAPSSASSKIKEDTYPPSPPRSPRQEPRTFSRPSSRPNSRPSSPVLNSSSRSSDSPQSPKSRDGFEDRFPRSHGSSRANPEPRVSSSLRHDTLPPPTPPTVKIQSPSPMRKPTTGSLPYPENDLAGEMMPSLDTYMPRTSDMYRQAPPSPTKPVSRPASPASAAREKDRPSKPKQKSRRTDDHSSSESEGRARQLEKRITFPDCPRRERSTIFDDWYCLDGYKSFAICPTCYNHCIKPTSYVQFFRSARTRPGARIKCDFSSPWVQMTWTMTLKQNASDLTILGELAEVAEIESECPGREKIAYAWYGLLHKGRLIPDFYICPFDVMQLEVLWPSLRAIFTLVRQPEVPRIPHRCSLRTMGPHFDLRISRLQFIDEQAAEDFAQGGPGHPDLTPFLNLLKLEEPCPRDVTKFGRKWFYMPMLPEFNVCEECFKTHIASSRSSLVGKFNQKVDFLPSHVDYQGNSCKLYLSYMRRVWDSAKKAANKADALEHLTKTAYAVKRFEIAYRTELGALERRLDTAKQASSAPEWRNHRDLHSNRGGPFADQRMIELKIQNLKDVWADRYE